LATHRDVAALPAPTRLKMPQLLDIIHGDGADTLILEDVSDGQTRPLQVSDLADLAEELGRWHGAGMHRRDNIARGWLRGYVREAEPLVAAFPEYRRQTPLLESLFTEPVHRISSEVWANRQLLLDALDDLPQVYSHQDLVANNVAVREGAEGRIYYLLDWDIAGMAPVGADLAPLLVGSAILMRWDIQASSEVLDDVIGAYRRGLLSKGVQIDMDTLRLSFSLASAVRYLAWAGHRVGSVMDPAKQRVAQAVTVHSLPEVIANYSPVRERLAAWGISAIAAISPGDIAVRA
jgi:Ser/Thr protein kinase RdoA (MazF antagonist)